MAKRGPPEFPWFRVYVDVTRDLKIRREPFCHRWIWVAVMALARRSPQPGRLLLSEGLPVTEADIADEANATVKQVRSALAIFTDRKMVTVDDGVLIVINWRKRQPESDRKYAGNTPEITDELPGNKERVTGLDTYTEVPSEPSEADTEAEPHPKPLAQETGADVSRPMAGVRALAIPKPGVLNTPQAAISVAFAEHFGDPATPPEERRWNEAIGYLARGGVAPEEAAPLVKAWEENYDAPCNLQAIVNNLTTLRGLIAGRRSNGRRRTKRQDAWAAIDASTAELEQEQQRGVAS